MGAPDWLSNLRWWRVIAYPIGTSGQALIFSAEVVGCFKRHQQLRWWQREAGGQLFARFEESGIHIVESTGPRRTDWRSRTSYKPDRVAEQLEIDERFRNGLHFVGDWHTHPEDLPRPSPIDLTSTADGFHRSRHGLNAFVMAIVGRAVLPAGLYVSLHDGADLHTLRPTSG